MKLTRPSEVTALLNRLDIRPSRVLGQNFLIDGNIVDIIVHAASLNSEDCVIEVGPGLGGLTEVLLAKSRHVTAIEKDKKLHAHIADCFADANNFELVLGDILDQHLESLFGTTPPKLIANLPYSVGTRFLMQVFELAHKPELIVVTVQREVADRLKASPCTKDYGLLSICAQAYYDVESIKTVKPTSFYPKPDILSAVVRMTLRQEPRVKTSDWIGFRSFVKSAFTQRRKKISTILERSGSRKRDGLLEAQQIDGSARPETLTIEQWGKLYEAFRSAD